MKATGIVRRIDDLGRVVVPKEIRKTLRIREGDPLEIFTDREGKIILKKYSPVGELGANAAILAESIARTLGCTVCITDLDQVVAASGAGSRELTGQYISEELGHMIQERQQRTVKVGEALCSGGTGDGRVLSGDNLPHHQWRRCDRGCAASGKRRKEKS